jgi:hypothetical protein
LKSGARATRARPAARALLQAGPHAPRLNLPRIATSNSRLLRKLTIPPRRRFTQTTTDESPARAYHDRLDDEGSNIVVIVLCISRMAEELNLPSLAGGG